MGKRTDIKDENTQRKKGLKNPIIFWILCFLLTFALTIVPSVFVSALSARAPSIILNSASWNKAIIDNLYPMIIAQSIITMLQNFSAAPPKTKEKIRQFVPCMGWTYGLIVFLVFYMIGYPAFVYANPPWRNSALYIISGILTAVGLASVLESNREQDRIQAAIEKEQLAKEEFQKIQTLKASERTLAWGSLPTALSDTDNPSTEAGEVSHPRDNTPALK